MRDVFGTVNVGALIIGIGFWGIRRKTQDSIGNQLGIM